MTKKKKKDRQILGPEVHNMCPRGKCLLPVQKYDAGQVDLVQYSFSLSNILRCQLASLSV